MKRLGFAVLVWGVLLWAVGLAHGDSVGNLHNVFKDDFPGSSLNWQKWNSPVLAGSAGYTVSGSNLVVTLTTGATDSFMLVSKTPVYLPNRATFSVLLSARSANQETIIALANKEAVDNNLTAGHYAMWKFSGTTATTGYSRTQNSGTAGTDTSRTIATTATVSLFQISLGIDDVRFTQTTVDNASTKSAVFMHTAKIPDPSEPYYVVFLVRNTGASSALTATFDFASVQSLQEMMVEVSGGTGDAMAGLAVPVNIQSNSASGTSQTVAGPAAHDATISGNPVRVAGRGMTSNYTAVATGETADLVTTLVGAQITKPYSIPELDWSYAPAAAITNTTDVVLKAAGAAGIKNYLTSIQIKNTNATATEVVVKDGSTVIWRGHAGASMTLTDTIEFPSPLKGTAATALNFACITTAASVYVNAQGYQAP